MQEFLYGIGSGVENFEFVVWDTTNYSQLARHKASYIVLLYVYIACEISVTEFKLKIELKRAK